MTRSAGKPFAILSALFAVLGLPILYPPALGFGPFMIAPIMGILALIAGIPAVVPKVRRTLGIAGLVTGFIETTVLMLFIVGVSMSHPVTSP